MSDTEHEPKIQIQNGLKDLMVMQVLIPKLGITILVSFTSATILTAMTTIHKIT